MVGSGLLAPGARCRLARRVPGPPAPVPRQPDPAPRGAGAARRSRPAAHRPLAQPGPGRPPGPAGRGRGGPARADRAACPASSCARSTLDGESRQGTPPVHPPARGAGRERPRPAGCRGRADRRPGPRRARRPRHARPARHPLHVLLTGRPDESDRQLAILQAPELRRGRRAADARAARRRRARPAGPHPACRSRPPGRPGRARAHRRRRPSRPRSRSRSTRPAPPCSRSRPRPGRASSPTSTTAPPLAGQRRARPPARAGRLRPALSGPARLAQPAQGRPRGRPRPLHHPAPAREAGRHADPRAGADRLPVARAVRGQAQGVRPHHLRQLLAPRPAAADLPREHRPLRRGGRRPARGRRARSSPSP